MTSTARTKLSVNVNKVAHLRNTRHLGIPSVTRAATLCLQAGAAGITVHPRPDARHIRPNDVVELATLMQDCPGQVDEYASSPDRSRPSINFLRLRHGTLGGLKGLRASTNSRGIGPFFGM